MSGFTAGATVLRGDYFQHGSGADARLYCIRTDGTADGSGELQMEIWPRLRTSPADLDTLTTTSPQGVFELASPDVSQSWEPFRNGYGFDILEAIQ
jgi:hypothetical protein